MRDKKSETLTNQGITYLMHQSQIGTINTWWSPNPNFTKLILNYIIKFEQPNKSDNNKHNPHTKLPLLNRHNQHPNITTVQMLTVLLQWLCGEVWESEFSYLWQQLICHRLCSFVYIYIMAPNSGGDCSLWLRVSDNPVHMSHVTFILH